MHNNLAAAEAIAPVASPEDQLNQELRILNDTKTWLAETLHGSMRTRFEFDYDGLYIRSEDGSNLDDIFDHSIAEARHMTEWNPSMSFELRRRLTEREELNDMYDMVNGDKPNTMVVFSDYPEELKTETESIGGYNSERQQTMMRVITWDDEKRKMTVITQSLDGSNREALEAAARTIGYELEPGELLGQRMYLDLPPAWSENLPENLTGTYDRSMSEQFGGEFHAGISQQPDKNIVDTYEFVSAQRDLIDWFVAKKLTDPKGSDKHRYDLAATFKARHEEMLQSLRDEDEQIAVGNVISGNMFELPSLNAMARALPIEQQLRINGITSAAAGDVFSGCGASLSSNREEDGDNPGGSMGGSGYRRSGGWSSKGKTDDDCEFISKKCPECGTKNVKTVVSKTHISGSCGCVKAK